MAWKIVNLDFEQTASSAAHLHLKDPNAPIHLRTFFADQRVEIALGGDHPEECFVRATVTADDVQVKATRFEPLHVQILASIFASLDVDPSEREAALSWMQTQVRAGGPLVGNVDSFPPPTGWPYDLDDDALLESLDDRKDVPHTRQSALLREAVRRGLRSAPPSSGGGGPEVFRRRR